MVRFQRGTAVVSSIAVPATSTAPFRQVGRYALFGEIASGGMATVHVGRLMGTAGFARTVAIKRLHPHFAKDPDFVSMALDEARIAARIQHPNVVSVLDVVTTDGEMFLVMDYIHGEALSRLIRVAVRDGGGGAPPRVAAAIVANALHGLHAAHEACSERGMPLGIVHRDVSPQNILVGADGVARVVDFGVAKAANRLQTTREGQLKGKLGYMSPEQLSRGAVDRRTDIYAAAVVLWEALVGRRLFDAEEPGAVVTDILFGVAAAPGSIVEGIPRELDDIVMRGLARDPARRFGTAREMALALEEQASPATASQVGEWVQELCGDTLRSRASMLTKIESVSCESSPAPSGAPDASSHEPLPPGTDHTASALTGTTLSAGEFSQVSSLSVATPMDAPFARKLSNGRVLALGVAAAIVVGVVAAFLAARGGGPDSVPATSPSASLSSAPGLAAGELSAVATPGSSPALDSASAATSASSPPVASVRAKPRVPSGKSVAPSNTTTRKRVHDFGF